MLEIMLSLFENKSRPIKIILSLFENNLGSIKNIF